MLLAGSLTVAAAFTLQGCEFAIPRHTVPNWEAKVSYLEEYQHVPLNGTGEARGSPSLALLNSCEDKALAPELRCNGHGHCSDWFDAVPVNTPANSSAARAQLTFCECDRDWTGPECSMQRKSQLTAFMLSMFLGPVGADQFYLGFYVAGVLKLLSLGGLGLWWIYDIVRIGSVPVMTVDKFRVANDVEHWAFVLVVLSFMGFLGFALSIWSIDRHRLQKAREIILLRAQGPEPAQKSFGTFSSGFSQPGASTMQYSGFAGPAGTLRSRVQ